MLKFLFWNIRKNSLERHIAFAARERKSDLLIIAESVDPIDILRELHDQGLKSFNHHDTPTKSSVEIFSRLPLDRIQAIGDHGRLNFRQVRPVIGKEFLLVGAHLQSKLRMSDQDQVLNCVTIADRVKDFERRVGHKRTIIVGDLNMNPFEPGLLAANGFHAAPTKTIARRGSRIVHGARYDFFYNPMWGKFGDKKNGEPAGTHYYDKSRLGEYFWHMFDQVLVRPDLIDQFDTKSLEIISKIGSESLLNSNGQPMSAEYSDHLPISFTLDFTKELS